MALAERDLEGGIRTFISTALEDAGIVAAFTERGGGHSEGAFRSLNLSLAVGDVPERVVANRTLVEHALRVDPPAWPEQVHGGSVALVDGSLSGAGARSLGDRIPQADALFTSARGVSIGILAADCVPVIVASPARRTIAVVHAGWRGLAAGIISRAIERFADGDVMREVRAVIGPAIGPCHYEVREDVVARVSAAGSTRAAVRRNGRIFLDLSSMARAILVGGGVRHIDQLDLCTWCEASRFFSHRRDGGRTGRQAAIAMVR